MRKIFGILLAAALVVPAAADGQEPGKRRQMAPGMHLEHLLEQRDHLGLTAEQVARLEAIHREVEQKNRPLMEKLRAMRGDAEHGEHARTEMSAEQREKHREMMKAAREKRSEMTEEEREKHRETMKADREKRQEMMKAAREKRSEMTEEEREQRRAAMAAARPLMEEMRANHKAAMEAVKEVLTDAQEAKLKALHESHPQMRHEGKRPARSDTHR